MSLRRVARVAERIREEASHTILYELTDPRIQMVTVTKVDLSRDMHHATIYVSVLGDEAKQRTVLRGLDSARGLIRSRIAKNIRLRETPDIAFQFDPTIASSIEISRLIDEALAESNAAKATDAADPDDPADVPEDEPADEPADDE